MSVDPTIFVERAEGDFAGVELLEVTKVDGGVRGSYRMYPLGDGARLREVLEAIGAQGEPPVYGGVPGMVSACRLLEEGVVLDVLLEGQYALDLAQAVVGLSRRRAFTCPALVSEESLRLLLVGALSRSGALSWS